MTIPADNTVAAGKRGNLIRTNLTERYGLDAFRLGWYGLHCIAGFGCGGFQTPADCGQLACGAAPPEVLPEMIAATRARTDRSFGVNFIIETAAFGPLTTEAQIRAQASIASVVDVVIAQGSEAGGHNEHFRAWCSRKHYLSLA